MVATGVSPRTPEIPGVDHPSVVSYLDVLRDGAPVGERVAVIGAGGIGFDVAEFLTDGGEGASLDAGTYFRQWGVDTDYNERGGLTAPKRPAPPRAVHLLQRKTSKVGAGLGKTTGWIHRTELKHRGVTMTAGATYERIDDDGLHVTVDGTATVLPVDTVVLCAGQDPQRGLYEELAAAGARVHLIGGADVAAELDAKRAIDQGTGSRRPSRDLSLGSGHVPAARHPHGSAREALVGPRADPPLRQVDRLLLVGHPSADLPRAGKTGAGGPDPGPAVGAAQPADRRRSTRFCPRAAPSWPHGSRGPRTRGPVRDPLLLRLRAAGVVGTAGLEAELERHLALHSRQLEEYRAIEERDFAPDRQKSEQDRLRHMVLRGGIELETFWTKWLTETLAGFRTGA